MAIVNYGVPFVNAKKITTTQAVLYTAPSSVVTVVFSMARLSHYQVSSGSGVVTTIDLWQVNPGEDETDSKFKFLSQKAMGVSQPYVLNELIGFALDAGGEIWGEASVDDQVSFSASGTERLS